MEDLIHLEPHHFHMLSNEDITLGEGTLYYDVHFYIDINDQSIDVRLYMDIEIQNEIYPGYPLVIRGISYSSRMISKQYGKEYDSKSYGNMNLFYLDHATVCQLSRWCYQCL